MSLSFVHADVDFDGAAVIESVVEAVRTGELSVEEAGDLLEGIFADLGKGMYAMAKVKLGDIANKLRMRAGEHLIHLGKRVGGYGQKFMSKYSPTYGDPAKQVAWTIGRAAQKIKRAGVSLQQRARDLDVQRGRTYVRGVGYRTQAWAKRKGYS